MSEDAPSDRSPIYLVASTTRAGSTLLASMLAAATDAFDCGELHLLWSSVASGRTCTCGQPVASCPIWSRVVERTLAGCGLGSVEEATTLADRELRQRDLLRPRWPAPDPDLVKLQRQLYDAIREVTGFQILVDSSKLASHLRTCLAAEPDSLLVHLTRDPRAVAHSWSNPRRDPSLGGTLMPSRSPLASAATWVGTNEAIARLVRRSPRSVHVRYEDLDRVGETYLARHVPGLMDGAGRAFGHSHAIAGNPARFTRQQAVVVDGRWRSEMPRFSRTAVSALTAPTGLRYGYPYRSGRGTRAG